MSPGGNVSLSRGSSLLAIAVAIAPVVVPLVVPLVVLLVVLLSSATAFGFCRTTTCAVKNPPPQCRRDIDTGCWLSGIPLTWSQQCVSFAVNIAASPLLGLDYDAALAIVQSGFVHWPTASCSDGAPSIAFAARGGLTCDRVEFNSTGPNANAIIFRDDDWKHDPLALALTTVAFNVNTGQILNADMEINSPRLAPSDLTFVVTHESGHFAGLDHSPEPTAVMFFQYGGGATADVRLTDDDIAAICDAYPPSRSAPVCDYEPPKGYATDCGGDVQGSCAVAPVRATRQGRGWIGSGLLLVAAVAYRVRARRRRQRQASQAGSRARSA